LTYLLQLIFELVAQLKISSTIRTLKAIAPDLGFMTEEEFIE
jgi:hypothetical protein